MAYEAPSREGVMDGRTGTPSQEMQWRIKKSDHQKRRKQSVDSRQFQVQLTDQFLAVAYLSILFDLCHRRK